MLEQVGDQEPRQPNVVNAGRDFNPPRRIVGLILLVEDQLPLAGDSQLVGLTPVFNPYHLAALKDIAGFPDRGLSGGRCLISSWFSISSRGVFTISHCFVSSNRQVLPNQLERNWQQHRHRSRTTILSARSKSPVTDGCHGCLVKPGMARGGLDVNCQDPSGCGHVNSQHDLALNSPANQFPRILGLSASADTGRNFLPGGTLAQGCAAGIYR